MPNQPYVAIAAISENRVIGNEGKIPWRSKLDFQWFKARTMADVLIMGRTTFDSIGKPLPGRTTIVLSRQKPDDANIVEGKVIINPMGLTYMTPEELEEHNRSAGANFATTPYRQWICGGQSVYEHYLDRNEIAHFYLTVIKKTCHGDRFLPNLGKQFDLDQIILENEDLRIERWKNVYAEPLAHETFPELK